MTNKIITNTHRKALKIRREPYYTKLQPGLSLGYRKTGGGAGNWIARTYHNKKYDYLPLGTIEQLTYEQARQEALTWCATIKTRDLEAGKTEKALSRSKLKITHVIQDYLREIAATKGQDKADDSKTVIDAHIRPTFGERQANTLTRREITTWFHGLVVEPDKEKKIKGRSQSTANRIFTTFKAVLNHGLRNEFIEADTWTGIKGFEAKTEKRDYIFNGDQLDKFISVAPEWFQAFLIIGRYTGARNGEIRKLRCKHFHADTKKLEIPDGKTGARMVQLSQAATNAISEVTNGLSSNELLVLYTTEEPSNKSRESRAFKDTIEAYNKIVKGPAKQIPDNVTYYSLRHTYITRALMAGLPVKVVAVNSGNSEAIIYGHYSHLIKDASQNLFDQIPL